VVSLGGMMQRWNSLRQQLCFASLLSAPYNLIAMKAGFNEMIKAVDVIGPYQGNVAAALRSWAAANKTILKSFVDSYRESIEWLYDHANRGEAIAILLANLPHMTQEIADASYAELLHPSRGFFKTCEIDAEGVACVLDLRSRYAQPSKPLGPIGKYTEHP